MDATAIYNDWLRSYCAINGFKYFDIYNLVGDGNPTPGRASIKPEYALDDLHCNAEGCQVMAYGVQELLA